MDIRVTKTVEGVTFTAKTGDRFLRAEGKFPTTREGAIATSVGKWEVMEEALRAGLRVEDGGPETCALCRMHRKEVFSLARTGGCCRCPVKGRTRRMFCGGTPCDDFEDEMDDGTETEELARLAAEEVAFLRSLQKKEKRG